MHALVTNAIDVLLASITGSVMPGIGSQTVTHLREIERDAQLVRILQTYHEIIDIVNFDKSVVGMLLWCYFEARRASVKIYSQSKLTTHQHQI
jgi:hypothetical protein